MKLELVWRNPAPLEPAKTEIEATEVAEDHSLYVVRTAGGTTAFELIVGGAA